MPTWNYQVVHASGSASVIEAQDEVRRHVLALVAQHEADSDRPWKPELPEDFMQSMLRQIVAIRIAVTRIETKFKLGQSRPRVDRENVAAWFEAADGPMQQALGRATRDTLA